MSSLEVRGNHDGTTPRHQESPMTTEQTGTTNEATAGDADPVRGFFIEYDPTPPGEEERRRAELLDRMSREGGVLLDGDGNQVATFGPANAENQHPVTPGGADLAWRTEWDERRRLADRDIPAAIRSLDALTDPTSRAILDHHKRDGWPEYRWACGGCDQGCSCDAAEWPCSTVTLVAELNHIDMTDADLFRRPADGSLDLPS